MSTWFANSVTRFSLMSRRLTNRQMQLVVHLANGHRVEEIGTLMHISPSTVEKTIKTARKNAGARTQAHLVALCIASGLLEWYADAQVHRVNPNNNTKDNEVARTDSSDLHQHAGDNGDSQAG